MRAFNIQVFDDIIANTTSTWYSSAEFSDLMGSADALAVAAVANSVSGTAPQLTVAAEHSCDGQNWREIMGTPQINGVNLANGGVYTGATDYSVVTWSYVRLKITLAGTSPSCRLKVFATGRTQGRAQNVRSPR